MAAGEITSGSDRAALQSPRKQKKPPDSGGFFSPFPPVPMAGKNPPACWTSGGRFAKRRPPAKAFRAGSGRIAQLVEQMTLNHRVPGSSPGAPTKLFKSLVV
jgi:hypothetical protein